MLPVLPIAFILLAADLTPRPAASERQVIDKAVTFLNRIGVAFNGRPTATYGISNASPGGPESHFQTRWRVQVPNVAELHVTDSDLTITWFENLALRTRLAQDPSARPGEPIPEREALKLALLGLHATGERGELLLDQVVLRQNTDPPSRLAHSWFVVFRRAQGGVPYRLPEAANIRLQAETGEVAGLSLTFLSRPPQLPRTTISADEGRARAGKAVSIQGFLAIRYQETIPMIVQPGPVFAKIGGASLKNTDSRYAWVSRYQTDSQIDTLNGPVLVNRALDVFVDAETGAVIGTDAHTGRAEASVPRPPEGLPQSVDVVRIFRRSANGCWEERPLLVLDGRTNRELALQLAAPPENTELTSAALPDVRIEITCQGEKSPRVLTYIGASRLFSDGQRSWTASEQWVQRLRPLTCKRVLH